MARFYFSIKPRWFPYCAVQRSERDYRTVTPRECQCSPCLGKADLRVSDANMAMQSRAPPPPLLTCNYFKLASFIVGI